MRILSPSQLRRFPTRINLRTLMLLVLVVGGGLGWFALHRQREAHRQRVIATIRASLSSVDFDGIGISRILWFGGSANPAAFPPSQLTAVQLEKLKSLIIPNTSLDDAGTANLGRLTGLKQLYIGGGAYTDAGVASLSNLTGLTDLGIGSEGCTDAGLVNLVGLTNLRTLNIVGSPIADAWLDRIAAMKSLREVHLNAAQISDEAMQRLHRSLPETEIYVNGRRK
jgi:hypothetical protein